MPDVMTWQALSVSCAATHGARAALQCQLCLQGNVKLRVTYEGFDSLPCLLQVLASDISLGYEDFVNTEVEAVNGHKIYNLEDLVNRVEECREEYVRLSLSLNNMIILNREAAQAATPAILAQHCIPKDRSENLQPVLVQ